MTYEPTAIRSSHNQFLPCGPDTCDAQPPPKNRALNYIIERLHELYAPRIPTSCGCRACNTNSSPHGQYTLAAVAYVARVMARVQYIVNVQETLFISSSSSSSPSPVFNTQQAAPSSRRQTSTSCPACLLLFCCQLHLPSNSEAAAVYTARPRSSLQFVATPIFKIYMT